MLLTTPPFALLVWSAQSLNTSNSRLVKKDAISALSRGLPSCSRITRLKLLHVKHELMRSGIVLITTSQYPAFPETMSDLSSLTIRMAMTYLVSTMMSIPSLREGLWWHATGFKGCYSFLLSASSALTITCSALDELTCLALHRNLAMWGQVDSAISFGCRPRVPSGGWLLLNGFHLISHAHVKLPGFAANVAQNNLRISVEPCLWYHHFSTACTDITAQQSLHCVMLTWLASPTLAWPFAGYSFTFFGIITKLNSFS